MKIEVRREQLKDIQPFRDLFRQEANCQIVHDSFLARGFADPYLILIDGQIAGYGAIANKHYEDRLIEFYATPRYRAATTPMVRELIDVGKAISIEAQTNIPSMLDILFDFTTTVTVENILFADSFQTALKCPDAVFGRASAAAKSAISQQHEPVGDWMIEREGEVLATGGYLCHYNPPYGDIYMEVAESARRQGIGSYLVQELKRVCYEAGKRPAARCNPDNLPSRLTLQKAGMLPCGRMLSGAIAGRIE